MPSPPLHLSTKQLLQHCLQSGNFWSFPGWLNDPCNAVCIQCLVLPLLALLRQREEDSNQDWVVHCTITKWLQGLQNAFHRAASPDQTTLLPWYLLFQSSFLQTSSSSSCLSFPTASAPRPLHQQIKPLFFLATHSSSRLPTPPCIPYFPSAKAGYQSFGEENSIWSPCNRLCRMICSVQECSCGPWRDNPHLNSQEHWGKNKTIL